MTNKANPAAPEWMEILGDLLEITGQLLDSAKRKQAVLASDKLDALQELMQEEELMAAALEKTERQRLELQVRFPAWPNSLSEQLAVLPEQERGQETELARKLGRTVKELAVQNRINSEIIQHLLNFTAYNLEQLYKVSSGPVYGSRGDVPPPVTSRAVVDRKI
ncbi:MAG: flagellar protein FlgN [Negativicutes bacterium]|nr:flagellar protein FlgN [Negativicutes bacterium]MDR3589763.1 flagellar protein FlgN [Negativicutes bacterium]